VGSAVGLRSDKSLGEVDYDKELEEAYCYTDTVPDNGHYCADYDTELAVEYFDRKSH